MNRIYLILSVFLLLFVGLGITFCFVVNNNGELPELFVGVCVAHYNLEEIIEIANQTNPYTNLFVVGSTGITYDVTKLDSVCTYLYNQGFSFLI